METRPPTPTRRPRHHITASLLQFNGEDQMVNRKCEVWHVEADDDDIVDDDSDGEDFDGDDVFTDDDDNKLY